ncbi:hypothetical protein SAMN04244572_00761 [Azotobacter beijerinckii]|uniref:NACHT domain-containing protein n=1 Tax=Azotobacter beijerinckii TaxID=170623 RepID=A0A1H6RDY4_9GAMM|nr:hypothetical protein [Azotobacter beijerinckii]SEI53953.1 hypothetical protein SAMN04244572_00761 [Azotobacter beijerinckii]
MIEKDLLLSDLALFSDLGVEPPKAIEDGGNLAILMTRNGNKTTLTFTPTGIIFEKTEDNNEVRHATYKALLASDNFGRLRDWANVQACVLGKEMSTKPQPIPATGFVHSQNNVINIDDVDNLVDAERPEKNAKLFLIDGPAGVGKTEFIKQLSLRRAKNFIKNQKPLILHVQSRGRVLTFLQDLIAFSLQTLRLRITFDQVPVLVRNGLITIAVDGFDELGDPSGYETAWAQVGDLITQVRGSGTLILAGRETFIGRDRLIRDIKALNSSDNIDSLTLQPPTPHVAQTWLKQQGWSDERLYDAQELLQDESFALRPIFLSHLGHYGSDENLAETGATISNLIELMVSREAKKFGDAVESVLSEEQRKNFVFGFLGEIARDMADNQSESADEIVIKWAAEAALEDQNPDAPSETSRILQNRALVMAFLTPDERLRHRRFSHSQIQNYFLGLETVSLIRKKEIPKFLRRNLLGGDFLVTFTDVIDSYASEKKEELLDFMSSGKELLKNYHGTDRGARNISALLICCAPFGDLLDDYTLANQQVDDALIRGIASKFKLHNCTINQLDIRDSDTTNIIFDKCEIIGLLINSKSKLSSEITPSYIQLETENGDGVRLISDHKGIKQTLTNHSPSASFNSNNHESAPPLSHSLFSLLDRAVRYRGYWFRDDTDDVLGRKIISDDSWPMLSELLLKHDFLRKEERAASGRPSLFYHIKRPQVLQKISTREEAADLYADMITSINKKEY